MRLAADYSELLPGCAGLGQTLEHAMVLRCAVSVCSVLFALRRASEIAGLRASGVSINEAVGVVDLQVRHQKNDQREVG